MKSKHNKFISINGTVLDNPQLENYMEKLAVRHNVKQYSDIDTYPIPRVKENFKFIQKTYFLLTEHLKSNIDIYPAGEWLLDNFYIIEETTKTIIREMNPQKYKKLPGLEETQYKGYSRIYVLASEIVSYTDSKIDESVLNLAMLAYQKKKKLTMDEIWNLWIFLEIAIIENIRTICEKIYSAQIQKYKVKSIIERLVEKKDIKNQKFLPIKESKETSLLYSPKVKYPFIEYMSYNLKQYGKQGMPYLNILEEQVNKMGLTISEVIQKEHFDIAIRKSINGK